MKLILKPNLTFERFNQLCESLQSAEEPSFCCGFYERLRKCLGSGCAPTRNLSVSEVQFKLPSSQPQSFSLLNSNEKTGAVQLYQLHDSNGCVVDFHFGPSEDSGNVRLNALKQLMKDRLGIGHALYLNSSFCSIEIARRLALRQTYLSGSYAPSSNANFPPEIFDSRTDSITLQSEGVFISKLAKSHLCTISTEFSDSNCYKNYQNALKLLHPRDFANCENVSFSTHFPLNLQIFTHFLQIMSQNAFILYKMDNPDSSILFQNFQQAISRGLSF